MKDYFETLGILILFFITVIGVIGLIDSERNNDSYNNQFTVSPK